MEINVKTIKTELDELAGGETVKIKLDKRMESTSAIRISDGEYQVRLNPLKIRSQQTLDKHLAYCRAAIGGF